MAISLSTALQGPAVASLFVNLRVVLKEIITSLSPDHVVRDIFLATMREKEEEENKEFKKEIEAAVKTFKDSPRFKAIKTLEKQIAIEERAAFAAEMAIVQRLFAIESQSLSIWGDVDLPVVFLRDQKTKEFSKDRWKEEMFVSRYKDGIWDREKRQQFEVWFDQLKDYDFMELNFKPSQLVERDKNPKGYIAFLLLNNLKRVAERALRDKKIFLERNAISSKCEVKDLKKLKGDLHLVLIKYFTDAYSNTEECVGLLNKMVVNHTLLTPKEGVASLEETKKELIELFGKLDPSEKNTKMDEIILQIPILYEYLFQLNGSLNSLTYLLKAAENDKELLKLKESQSADRTQRFLHQIQLIIEMSQIICSPLKKMTA